MSPQSIAAIRDIETVKERCTRLWVARNKERVILTRAAYRIKNRQRIKETMSKWRIKNRAHCAAYLRKWRQAKAAAHSGREKENG